MRVTLCFYCALLSLAASSAWRVADDQGTVQGVVTDVSDARILNAKLAFRSGSDEYLAQTEADRTYSIALKAGTYSATVSSTNFCTFRRAAFILPKRSAVRLNFQMWVCPTDVQFIRYVELDEVPQTHLKPLVLFAKNELRQPAGLLFGERRAFVQALAVEEVHSSRETVGVRHKKLGASRVPSKPP
jgi:hypothetical protein